ncbi:MAG TPA: S8 family serine peptidase, partial [Symbiobacteriaceae bacterium]|nr:S8 family serine peptidase [Symbiobacteriaceae bacterium]
IAAGNSGPARYTVGSPGAAEKALTVGAMMDASENGFGLASFSSRGPTRDERVKPEIGAPGVNISAPKANSGNGYVVYSGTSMATPFVSGTIALMLDADPTLTIPEMRDILRATAQDWGPAGQDVDYGWGRLDGHAAVKVAGTYTGGTAPTVPGHTAFSGRITSAGTRLEHTVSVSDTSYPLNATLIMPGWTGSGSPDFDLFVYNPDGSELGRATGTARQEQVAKPVTQAGIYRLVVEGYAGAGDYLLDVSAGLGEAPDREPAVAVEQPADGATVSGTATVKVRATDDRGVAKVELAVDGGTYLDITAGFDGTHYTYAWNTTTVGNGAHTLTARVTDTGGQQVQAVRNVTVSNSTTPPPPPTPGLQQQVTRTGRVTAGARDVNLEVAVHEPGWVDLSLAWGTRADLDFYVYAPDGTQVGRAFTLNNPERLRVDTVRWGTGTYRVRVNLYGGVDSDFTLTASGYKEETLTGAVSPGSRDANHNRQVAYRGTGRAVLRWQGSSDVDFFVYSPNGQERVRAYTLNNPEQADIPFDATGAWRVRVNLYAGSAVSYTLKLYVPEAVLE